MKRAIIFANGTIHNLDTVRNILRADDYIIAADNGAAHCAPLGLTPHVIIGDMDSIDPALLAKYEQQGVTITRHPVEKNETDLELALLHAAAIAPQEILVFGIVGDRWDMTAGRNRPAYCR